MCSQKEKEKEKEKDEKKRGIMERFYFIQLNVSKVAE
jgi:hypothetical protein